MHSAGSAGSMPPHVEERLGIELAEFGAKAVATGRDGAYAAPLAVANAEDPVHELAGTRIPVVTDDSRVAVVELGAPLLQLLHRREKAAQQIDRLEAGDHDRDPMLPRQRGIVAGTDDSAHVARPEEGLHAVVGGRYHRRNGGRHEHVGDKDAEVA